MYACEVCISEAITLEVTAIDRARRVLRIIGKDNKERPPQVHKLGQAGSMGTTTGAYRPDHSSDTTS